jgi:hypothetical protein
MAVRCAVVLCRMLDSFHKWAIDYLQHMLAPLDNFISRGPDIFLKPSNPFVKMTMDIAVKVHLTRSGPADQRKPADQPAECCLSTRPND